MRCGAHLELNKFNQLKVTAWIPQKDLFAAAVEYKTSLSKQLRDVGLSLLDIHLYPTPRALKEPSVPPGFRGLELSV